MCIISWGEGKDGKAPPSQERQTVEDIFFVLATLGQHLYSLEVLDYSVLAQAQAAVREAFYIGDNNAELATHFDKAKPEDQCAVTCAVVFCSECWPMRIWQGFGCGLMDLMNWVNVQDCKEVCRNVDKSIAALKGKPHEWQLLTKSPARIGQTAPIDGKIPKPDRKETVAFWRTVVGEYDRRGFPKPMPPHDPLEITTWSIPYAIAGGDVLYKTCGHDFKAACKYQMDAGRLFYAWTVGKHAELRPGEGLLLMQDHVGALAEWLEGLNGVIFKVLLDSHLEEKTIKFDWSTNRINKRTCGNEQGIAQRPYVMVGCLPSEESPVAQVQKNSITTSPTKDFAMGPTPTTTKISPCVTTQAPPPAQPQNSSPPAYSPNPASPISALASGGPGRQNTIKRRAVPIPPAPVKRTVMATHDFKPVGENELGFKTGDLIDIIDDGTEDGWWMARIAGKEGLIPCTYVQQMESTTALNSRSSRFGV